MKRLLEILIGVMMFFSCSSEKPRRKQFVSPILFTDLSTPIVKFAINGNKYYFIIDTGSKESFISDRLFYDGHNCPLEIDTVYTAFETFNGKTEVKKMHKINVALDDSINTDMMVANIDRIIHYVFIHSGHAITGIIGADFAKKHKAVIDYKNKEFKIEK